MINEKTEDLRNVDAYLPCRMCCYNAKISTHHSLTRIHFGHFVLSCDLCATVSYNV